jgi:hypothetical protein
MGVLYVAGLPLSIAIILIKRRHTLFGDGSDETRRVYGFLYDAYGPVAWWWEVEELLRKLFLTALVVLMDPGTPLQVTLAVLVSCWAHVLHAMYKPWRLSSKTLENRTYMVQHASLLVTTFVFLMGLLFKVEGVSSRSPTYESLSVVMLLLCIGFVAWWFYEMFSLVVAKAWRRVRGRGGRGAKPSDPSRIAGAGVGAPVSTVPGVGVTPLCEPRQQLPESSHSDDGVADAAATSDARSTGHRIADVGASFRDIGLSSGGSAVVANPMYVRRAHVAASAPAPDVGRALGYSGGSDGDASTSALSVYFQARPAGATADGRSGTRAGRVSVLGTAGGASQPPS